MTTDRKMPIDLTISEAGIQAIKNREGLLRVAYDDIGGTRTIGYGHTGGVRPGERISIEAADILLRNDLAHARMAIIRNVTVPITPGAMDALASFVFNVGEEAFAKSDVLREVNKSNWLGAAQAMKGWCNVHHQFSKGLYNRRKQEAAQLLADQ